MHGRGDNTMQRMLAQLVIGVAITAIGMFGADNSLGAWKRNVAKSKTSTPITNPIKSLMLVNEPSPGAVKQTVSGERTRSEEHTSELQSQSNLVCRLLLEKKKEMS